MNTSRLWTANYIMLMVCYSGVSLAFITLLAYSTTFAQLRFDVDGWKLGFASSSFFLGAVFIRLCAGSISRFISERQVLVWGMVLFCAPSIGYMIAPDYWVFIAVRVIQGIGFGLVTTFSTSLLVRIVPETHRARGLGYFLTASTLALGVGPSVSSYMQQTFGAASVFWVSFATSIIGFVAGVMFLFRGPVSGPPAAGESRGLRIDDVVLKKNLLLSCAILISGAGYACTVSFGSQYFDSKGLPQVASTFFLVLAVAMLVLRMVGGGLQDRFGANWVVYPFLIILCASFALLALADLPVLLILAGMCFGLGYGAALPAIQTVAVSRAEPHEVTVAVSTHYLMLDFGVLVGPIVFGVLIPDFGFVGVFAALALTMPLMIVIYWFTHGRHDTPKTVQPAAH